MKTWGSDRDRTPDWVLRLYWWLIRITGGRK